MSISLPSDEHQLYEETAPASQTGHHCCEQCLPKEPLPTKEKLLS